MGETVVVVRLDRVMFSVSEVKVKLEPGSVVFMLSWPWMEKQQLCVRMLQRACVCAQPLPKCYSSSLDMPCFASAAKPSQAE